MKGKVLGLKIVLTLLIALTASICVCLGSLPKQEKSVGLISTAVSLGEGSNKQDFSALFGGDIIFSAEKVGVNSDETDGVPNVLTDGDVKTFPTQDANGYTFVDIPSNISEKTVIDNGGVVRLDNIADADKHYIANQSGLQEAIMVSFGVYVYDSENKIVNIADDTTYSNITYLTVSMQKDGKTQNIPAKRTINADDGIYYDFAYLITQSDTNEGHYKFTFNYMAGFVERTVTFEFYILNNSSYIQTLSEELGYNAKPTLGWTEGDEFAKSPDSSSYTKYYIGTNGVQTGTRVDNYAYPTITYDYTKYKLSYIHTSNQKTTNYSLNSVINPAVSNEASLVWTISNSDGTTTKEYDLLDYDETSTIHLVTIMLTEPGTYVFNYTFLYDGYNGTNAPTLNFQTEELRLSVHGFSVNYSKAEYESARMQYYEIAYKPANNIDLIIPNGYSVDENINSLKNGALGFMYSLKEDDLVREGNIVSNNTLNSLVNYELKEASNTSAINDYEYLIDNYRSMASWSTSADPLASNDAELAMLLSSINYKQTNQGSLWLKGNDSFDSSSFYLYSSKTTKPTASDFAAKQYSNTTSFNQKGYYLIFINVVPSGAETSNEYYWQIFAFQYTSSSANITLQAVVDDKGTTDTKDDVKEDVAGGKYTNKPVEISWKKPGIFDRNIEAYYYTANQAYSREELLDKTTKRTLSATEQNGEYVARLGSLSEVANGTFARYLIRLESEGESATHKIFTIDRQPIANVQAYLIEEAAAGNSIYYRYATDNNNNFISIDNAITDGFATISWAEKLSGAEITATYSYTPFSIISRTDDNVKSLTGNSGYTWITTNYELGTTISGADLKSATSKYDVDSNAILFNQGIYVITIKDAAGNSCVYAFVIDRTSNYIQLTNEGTSQLLTDSSAIYATNVDYNIGQYKAFKLNTGISGFNSTLKSIIENAAIGTLNSTSVEGYYSGNYNNISVLSKLFQKLGEDYYFTVENNRVYCYTDEGLDPNIKGKSGSFVYSVNGESSYYRTMYVVAANHLYSTSNIKDGSFVSVEINKDNARGYAYYSDSQIANLPTEGKSSDTIIRLNAGSDGVDDYGNDTNGMIGARATSAKHVGFVWNMGTGNFEVATVTYSFYSLKNEYQNDKYYFYAANDTDLNLPLYNEGTWSNGAAALSDGRGYVSFNGSSSSREGLYVVTRTYKSGDGLGEDSQTMNYYFIVDRKGIIDGLAGGSIRIELMEGEDDFNTFDAQGTDYGFITDKSAGIDDERYNIYLSTNKLPATLNIPLGKYFIDEDKTSASYYAGKLNVSVYFVDYYNQLIGITNNNETGKFSNVKLYDSKTYSDNGISATIVDGCFVVNIYDYLTKYGNSEVLKRIAMSKDGQQDWLFLSGDYVIVITDNSLNTLKNTHTKYIGIRINGTDKTTPQVESFTGYNNVSHDMVKISALTTSTTATVSQEYLKVVLPEYQNNIDTKAQVDPNYIIVKQYIGNNTTGTYYINHPYTQQNGINLVENSKYVTIENGALNIWLDTMLRDGMGNIDLANLNRALKYEITIRYKLNNYKLPYNSYANAGDYEKYAGCYVYYTTSGGKVVANSYYQKTYVIVIDREAPSGNITELNTKDSLVAEYNKLFGTTTMFENGLHQTSSNIYFTKQYAKYYQEKTTNKGYIYAYIVPQYSGKDINGNDVLTRFISTDVAKVLTRAIGTGNALSSYNLTLPVIDEGKYTSYNFVPTTYSALGLTNNTYYEIVEIDAAGNATQYVINYNPSIPTITMPVTVNTTTEGLIDATLSLDNSENYYIYDINTSGDSTCANELFFKIELKNGNSTVLNTLTTSTTDFAKIGKTIVDVIKVEKVGTFTLNITTRTNAAKSLTIVLYNQDQTTPIYVENLVKKDSKGNYSIELTEANRESTIDGKTIIFFATEIAIKVGDETTTYVGILNNGIVEYYEKIAYQAYKESLKGESPIEKPSSTSTVPCNASTTYHIVMIDVFGKESSYRFNTSGYEFATLSFAGNGNFFRDSDNYYAYTDATLKYDTTVYDVEVLRKESNGTYSLIEVLEIEDGAFKSFTLSPIYEYDKGGLSQYVINLLFEEEVERTYNLTFDTRLSDVALRDYTTGIQKDIIKITNNTAYNNEDGTRPTTTGSGIMNLHWSQIEENNYFDYVYYLYELLDTDEYKQPVDLSNQSDYVISTTEGSKGIYKFEIRVYTKGNAYNETAFLGNRIYAFEVQELSTQVYYVRNKETGEGVLANSSFKVSELKETTYYALVSDFVDSSSDIQIPLYITNQDLEVVITMPNVTKLPQTIIEGNGVYSFTMYKISKTDAYTIYLGIMQVFERTSLVSSVNINGEIAVESITSHTVYGEPKDVMTIQASKVVPSTMGTDPLWAKNTLLLEVYYTNIYVTTVEFDKGYTILGNGQYSFVFKDSAGYVHKYANNATELNVYVLREIVVTINGEALIENAFYNDEVSLAIYASNKYVTGSVKIKAYRNGEEYIPTGYNPYIFSEYGNYKVVIEAKYNNGQANKPLTKVVRFTIINVKEARSAIDLTSLSGCKITKVLNPTGKDVTNAFLTMMKQTAVSSGMKISYEDIIAYENNTENKEKLYITSGKLTFTLTYLVDDGIYPARSVNLSFTLNNETPSIECTLDKGDSTTKSFTIYFNPTIIYEQIGEAYVYINDELVAHITESSSNEELRIETSFKKNGDGDYYVKLVSSSGTVLDSYKVTIKEPLNFWAIVVIIVVVGVVATVVITIIVLRRKMRIR